VTGIELWKSDGTNAGTVLVKDIGPSGVIGVYDRAANVNGTLFFVANDGTSGPELWKSDGTEAGTIQVKDIRPGSDGGNPIYLTSANGTLFFSADDGAIGREAWKSDGTPAGTVMVKDINPGAGDGPSFGFASVNGTVFFRANDGTNGTELWKSDGTTSGTVMVKDINPAGSSHPIDNSLNFANVNGTLFFSANDGATGRELWKSDGTSGGTVMVKDINPGTGDSNPAVLTNVNGRLYFSAFDGGTTGIELWTSDGTSAGTVLVQDLLTGINTSSPNGLTNVNGTLFFAARDDTHGRELWVIPPPPDLSATKTNNVGGSTVVAGWTWTITVSNSGVGAATFSAGQTILSDNLPSTGLSYGSPSVVNPSGVTGTGSISCSISGNNLACAASGGAVTIAANTGSFQVQFVATPNTTGTFANPRSGGSCSVDPDGNISEDNETNNACSNSVTVTGLDFGDAPTAAQSGFAATYPTRLSDDGARHTPTGPKLGGSRDAEVDGQPSVGADGDDAGGAPDDEDGVTFGALVAAMNASITVNLQNPDALSNRLDAWIDYNRDGDWFDAGEQVFSAFDLGTTAGTQALSFTVPATASIGTSYVRLRLSTAGGLAPTGAAADGEVEDYQVTLQSALPTLNINDATVTAEGSSGSTKSAIFTVSLSAPAEATVTVNFATANGTATAPADYTAASGTVTFPVGTTTRTITVLTKGDALDEDNETFFVNLSNPSANAVIGDGQGAGTIVDDDALPKLKINDVSVTEGSTGTKNATFTVTLTPASGRTVTVAYATADGTAVADSDYQTTAGSLNFTPGQLTKTIAVPIVGDTADELNETFFVNLAVPVNATFSDAQGKGTITDDDNTPSLTINDVAVIEGGDPETGGGQAVFTVSLSAASRRTVTVKFATATGTATTPADYQSTTGTLTFDPGDTMKTVTVPVFSDGLDEPDESYSVKLSTAVNATIADTAGLGTIQDADPPPTVSINDVTVTEGVAAVFTVSLSAASGKTVSVKFATANGSATSSGDYSAKTGTLSFTPGQLSKTVSVTITGDTTDEPDETFFVNLNTPINATIADGQGQGDIVDNDLPPKLTIADKAVTEGTGTTANAVFTVTLSAASGKTVSVNFDTADGTATAPADYTTTSGTISFAPGQTSKTISVPVIGDSLDEAAETFLVNLSGEANASIADGQGKGTITDNDATPSLRINDVTIAEGNVGTITATFTVTLSAASGQTVTVNYASANGTATSAFDYVAASGTLAFAPGDTTKLITVTVDGDTTIELDETFLVNLSGAVNATIADTQGVGKIRNDDVAISISDVVMPEGNSGTTTSFTFTVSLSAPQPLGTVTVLFGTANDTALAGGDYTAKTTTVSFSAGQTAKTVAVSVLVDAVLESDETFTVNLSNAVNAVIADAQAIGTIINDD
jgi:ELWxxDGT repeat protein